MNTYTKQQAGNIILKQVETGNHYLPVSVSGVEVTAENIGEGTFANVKIPSIVKDKVILMNLSWFNQASEQEIKYQVWHDVRRLYQNDQVDSFKRGVPIMEELDTVLEWEANVDGYIPNTTLTEQKHFSQAIEMDAHAFAAAMVAVFCSKADGSMDIAIPPVIAEKVVADASERFKEMIKVPVSKSKTDRNGSCPCGSGRKYKKCCAKTGFFE